MATGHDLQNQRLAGRIGGLVTHSRHDSSAITSSARRAFLARFLVEVDPLGELTEAERERRAEFARRAYFARLAMMSATARAKATAPTAPGLAAPGTTRTPSVELDVLNGENGVAATTRRF